jgi:coenzyme PQQ synthesis protein D (PqqD)
VNTTSYRRRPDVLWRRSLDTVLCLPPDSTEPVTLAGTGPEVWDLLQTPHSLAELAAELAARHRVDAEVVATDVRPVLERLAALGVIEPVL